VSFFSICRAKVILLPKKTKRESFKQRKIWLHDLSTQKVEKGHGGLPCSFRLSEAIGYGYKPTLNVLFSKTSMLLKASSYIIGGLFEI